MSKKVVSKATRRVSDRQQKRKSSLDISMISLSDNRDSSMSIEEDSKESVSNFTKFSQKLLKTDYLEEIIQEGETEKHCYCTLCECEILCNNLLKHIQTKKHRKNTPNEEIELLETSIQTCKKTDVNSLIGTNKDREDTRGYLEFIAFLMSLKLSYLQIEKIGFFLKDLLQKKNLIS